MLSSSVAVTALRKLFLFIVFASTRWLVYHKAAEIYMYGGKFVELLWADFLAGKLRATMQFNSPISLSQPIQDVAFTVRKITAEWKISLFMQCGKFFEEISCSKFDSFRWCVALLVLWQIYIVYHQLLTVFLQRTRKDLSSKRCSNLHSSHCSAALPPDAR